MNSSKTSFRTLESKVSNSTLKAVKEMGFDNMTEIQARTIPQVLTGNDAVVSAKTGSGKTLAFLISAIELLHKLEIAPRTGTCVIVISPNRELAAQTYVVVKELLKYHSYTHGVIMSGMSQQSEAEKLISGVNILIATPERLLYHLQHTRNFLYKHLQCLVIDEADRILDSEAEEEMKRIIKLLPKTRQTLLFATNLTKKTEAFIQKALKKQPMFIGLDDEEDNNEEEETVCEVHQGYVVCPSEKRFQLLFTFLKKNRQRKVMVYFSSCMSVTHHNDLLNHIDLPVTCIHGKQKQSIKKATFSNFCTAKSGILLCTDVAARGLDIPPVDWVVQYDPPDDVKEYRHRVANKSRVLLFLRPQETDLLQLLKRATLQEYDFSLNRVANVQNQLEKVVSKNYSLQVSAQEAFKAYVRAYRSHRLKKVFDVQSLDLKDVAKSFGLEVPPFVST